MADDPYQDIAQGLGATTWLLSEHTLKRLRDLQDGKFTLRRRAKGWRRHVRKMKAAKRKNG